MYALLLAYNADESAVLRIVLQRAGFASRITTDLEASIQAWQEKPSDLVLLAIKDLVAIEKIRELRALTEVPIVLVSKPIQEDLHVDLLETGVDLIVFRPFSARIMISQLRALMRRAMGVICFQPAQFYCGRPDLRPIRADCSSQRSTIKASHQVGISPSLHLNGSPGPGFAHRDLWLKGFGGTAGAAIVILSGDW